MRLVVAILLLSYATVLAAQTVQVVTPLSQELKETSGLIYLNGKLITHNDGGGEPALYEIDTLTGNYSRKVTIANAVNDDWEDLSMDNNYIYIGDFGNNNGNRTNLKIYRILIADYLNTANDTAQADVIDFTYADQTDFSYSQYSTNFDAEALIAFNDTLYVFTKNWGNHKSYIYSIPNSVGAHSASKIDSLNPQGLITGSTYDSLNQRLTLLGNQTMPFIFTAGDVVPPSFSSNTFSKVSFSVQNSIQIEGITTKESNSFYLSAEQNQLGVATLYQFQNENSLSLLNHKSDKQTKLYPNPLTDILFFDSNYYGRQVSVYDARGKLIMTAVIENKLDISVLETGVYFVQFNGEKTIEKIIKK